MSPNSESQATPPAQSPLSGDIGDIKNVTVKQILLQNGTGNVDFPYLSCGPFKEPFPVVDQQYEITFGSESQAPNPYLYTCFKSGVESFFK